MKYGWLATLVVLANVAALAQAPPLTPPTPAQRGEQALLGRTFIPAMWAKDAYRQLWRRWGDHRSEPPPDYAQAVMDQYGLHPAPYANGGYPMGLRETTGLFGKGLTNDCLVCHGGSIAGRSYVGLGNASLDYQALWEDFNSGSGRPARTPFVFCNVRGTSEAASMAVFLLGYRQPDLSLRLPRTDLGLRPHLCEDVPAWWLLKKKKTMYHTGSGDARSVRSLMQFMLNPLNSADTIRQAEPVFKDIQAYLLSLQPPRYPFPIDRALARQGETLFRAHCARCHGTYGQDWTYPNKIIPLDVIGTDRTRYDGVTAQFGRYYNQTWFAHERGGWLADGYPGLRTTGYQAPPLDGIWATAPYFHNGSVPTVYHVLNSKARPKIYTRSFRTGKEDYDPVKLGWKVTVLDGAPDLGLPAFERRKVYDTRLPGRANRGHTFGDKLTEAERLAVIEYLKTL